MKKGLILVLTLMLLMTAALSETGDPDLIEDTVTSESGIYEVAFVADVGDLKDRSFNEGTWNGVKSFAAERGLTYKYYIPANGVQTTDDDRFEAMAAAAEGGAKVVVAAGFLQHNALKRAAEAYPDVIFLFNDGDAMGLDNVLSYSFHEEQCGYLAGYAAVRGGFEQLGFSGGGGGTNAACCRYGYGYIQGANAAAVEMGKHISIRFSWAYGASFSGSADLQMLISSWYATGTEIVFACGGAMFESISAAAAANDGYVIGVDVDQSYLSDTVLTSALKGITSGTRQMLEKVYDGSWKELNGFVTLGISEDAVGLPIETWSMENFTIGEYNAIVEAMKSGALQVDADAATGDPNVRGPWSNVTVDYIR
ncbi:MAG: BMP family ABC transporter substrate-binding protein [Clostridia bacterium]|nr:BMP family ABC transporter substrate-binding protein [Clostridia bacterium]